MEDEENSSLNVEYDGQIYELTNLSKDFAAYLCIKKILIFR